MNNLKVHISQTGLCAEMNKSGDKNKYFRKCSQNAMLKFTESSNIRVF